MVIMGRHHQVVNSYMVMKVWVGFMVSSVMVGLVRDQRMMRFNVRYFMMSCKVWFMMNLYQWFMIGVMMNFYVRFMVTFMMNFNMGFMKSFMMMMNFNNGFIRIMMNFHQWLMITVMNFDRYCVM